MGLGCSGSIAKLLLFVINFAVFACGAVLLGVGIALVVDDEIFTWISDITDGSMDDGLFKAAVYLMVIIGAVLFIVGFFGCCGACKENTCMLTIYACLVSVFLIVQIGAGILAAVFSSEVDDGILEKMQDSAREDYGKYDDDLTKAWDSMQMAWECCGANNHTDYLYNDNITSQNLYIPASCCVAAVKNDGGVQIDPSDNEKCQNATGGESELYYSYGCYYSFKDWVEQNTKIIMGVFFSLAGLQLIGVLFACCVKGKIKSQNKVA